MVSPLVLRLSRPLIPPRVSSFITTSLPICFPFAEAGKGQKKQEERRGQGPEMARNKFNVTEGVGAA